MAAALAELRYPPSSSVRVWLLTGHGCFRVVIIEDINGSGQQQQMVSNRGLLMCEEESEARHLTRVTSRTASVRGQESHEFKQHSVS